MIVLVLYCVFNLCICIFLWLCVCVFVWSQHLWRVWGICFAVGLQHSAPIFLVKYTFGNCHGYSRSSGSSEKLLSSMKKLFLAGEDMNHYLTFASYNPDHLPTSENDTIVKCVTIPNVIVNISTFIDIFRLMTEPPLSVYQGIKFGDTLLPDPQGWPSITFAHQ